MIRTVIVDDELLAGVGLQSLIDSKEDIQVSGVFNMPEKAIEYLRENSVDVVITDIEMADMNGLEFIQIIRKEKLANGVIIVSCHDDFSYAQRAISMGTDSYLLKHSISSQVLVEEIHKAYQKALKNGAVRESYTKQSKSIAKGGIYVLVVLRLSSQGIFLENREQNVEGTMLLHLLEGIVSRYDMGTLFSPYNRETFIIFQFPNEMPAQERAELLESNLSAISRNTKQYINDGFIFGVSRDFVDLKETQERYDEAVAAIEMQFYEPEKVTFIYNKPMQEFRTPAFSGDGFLKADGIEIFERELEDYLQKARFCQLTIQNLKGGLIQEINKMVYRILREHWFSAALVQKWNSDAVLIEVIMQASNGDYLKRRLTEAIGQFRKECQEELERDELSGALEYIEQNLTDKLSLAELAERSCMSIPSFSKKFKERTGMTLVQYLNERRIEQAKLLLENRNYSLEQIAEETGFSNTNYLIRVFKKVTGQTISEYRK